MTQTYDLIVIGEGVSGLACAGHAARAGLRAATFESNLFGGLVLNVNELDGYPGAESGTDLASGLMQANSEAGVASLQEEVTAIAAGGAGFEVVTRGGTHAARAVVIASGARLRKLGVPGEQEFEGRGVSSCADCDAPMFMNEDVVVAGGGDSAMQEALVLANFCRVVRVAHRGGKLRAQKHLADRVAAHPKISIMWKTTVEAILGGKMVEKVRLRNGDGKIEEIACAGVFACIGLDPNSAFAPSGIGRDERGHLVTNDALETTMKGIWAIGAVRAGYSGLLRDAAAEAQRAADAVRSRLD
ncbi:MAG TPA: FAD-dependent oxidoreductase [Burkholderiales bacterium]|nr:FAD-dependent oxidoreductase [Burkholderiales bacterium]